MVGKATLIKTMITVIGIVRYSPRVKPSLLTTHNNQNSPTTPPFKIYGTGCRAP
jgi:hypothetical protein